MNNNLEVDKNIRTVKMVCFISLIFGIVIFLYGVLGHKQRITQGVLVIASNIITIIIVRLGTRKRNLTMIIVIIYYYITVHLQLVFSIIAPKLIQTVFYNKAYTVELFNNSKLIIEYFSWGTIFCCIGVIVALISESFVVVGPRSNGSVVKVRQIYIIFICYGLINLWAAHQSSGYIFYLNKGLGIYVLGSIVVSRLLRGISVTSILWIMSCIGWYSLPEALVGKRATFVEAIVVVVIFLACYFIDDFLAFTLKHLPIICIFVGISLIWFSFIGMRKWGTITASPLRLIIKRITGLFDGLTILSYLEHHNVDLGLNNFIQCAFLNSGIKGTIYYTVHILGLPRNAHTSFAAPIFVVSKFYGTTGMIIISIIHLTMLTILCKKLKRETLLIRESMNYSNLLKAFIFIYLIVYSVNTFVLDGNVETLKAYSVHVLVFFMIFITSTTNHEYSVNYNMDT